MTSDMIVDSLCGAVSTIVATKLQELKYDQTYICTIVDDSKANNGEYRVSDGSIEFIARSENTSYTKDEQVRVSVLRGDMTQEKFIIGKYVNSSSNVPITYMDPLDSVMKMTNNLFNQNGTNGTTTIYSLTANDIIKANQTPKKTNALLSTISLSESTSSLINTKMYDTAYIQADFKTTMSEFNVISGHYGLMISLGQTDAEGKYLSTANYMLDSSQMLGNPYSFSIFTQQAAKFDVSNLGVINTIKVYFYQNGDFTHITHSDEAQNIVSALPNILVKDITIGFGTNVLNVADETVKLFCLGDEEYSAEDNSENLHRDLTVAWYNKDDLGQSIRFNDGSFDGVITDTNRISSVTIDGVPIKFVDEYKYLELAEENNRRSGQVNYDIPMDVPGLEVAAAITQVTNDVNSLSTLLSVDLHQEMEKFQTRCNLKNAEQNLVYTSQIKTLITEQKINDFINVSDAINDMSTALIQSGLNRAAKKYNTIPDTISGTWSFAASSTTKPSFDSVNYTDALNNYFNTIKTDFNNHFNSLEEEVLKTYSGYKGIYDSFKIKIDKILDSIQTLWEKTYNTIKYFSWDEKTIAKKSLVDWILSYWPEQDNYNFSQWTEKSLKEYENGYSVYWYRKNPEANDRFAGKGWELVDTAYVDYETKKAISLNPLIKQDIFKTIVFFNHKKHESNTITFINTIDFDQQIADLSNFITIHHGENSQESYQSYGQYNTLLNGADRYKKRIINVTYTNHETGLVENDKLSEAQIYWYIPKYSTMLTYDTTDLGSLNPNNKFTDDINSSADQLSDRQKAGYTMFYKTIKGVSAPDGSISLDLDLQFSYRIKEYYVPSASENHILCDVIIGDVVYSSEILMNFSSYGTSGSDYTLVVSPHTNQNAITLNNTQETPFLLDIRLFDNKNEQMSLNNVSVSVSIINSDNSKLIAETIETKDGCKVYLKAPLEDEDSSTDKYGVLADILEVSVSGIAADVGTLTTLYPIAYSVNTAGYIEGASTVIYDSNGGSPSYYKDPYKYFTQLGEQKNITWELCFTPTPGDNENIDHIKACMPTLQANNALRPCNMWNSDCNVDKWEDDKGNICLKRYYAYVEGKDESGNVIWRQPLIIMQNRYPSPMLNAWDGKFKINEENGTILSTMVGAGRKNTKNQFEGVLMGDIEAGAGFNPENKSGLGIYGFNAGEQSFGFNIDGTAFLGKAGLGRICFNGNSGTIQSASYSSATGHSGMMIDLDDGKIHILGTAKNQDGKYTSDGTKSEILINALSPYLTIKSQYGNELIKIANNEYYLKTDNFDNATQGVKLDLQNGELIGYDFNFQALSQLGSGVVINSNGNPYLQIKTLNSKNEPKITLLSTTDDFYLQSVDYAEGNGGTRLDLNDGSLQSYGNFILKALKHNFAGVLLSSGVSNLPYLKIVADNGKEIFFVNDEEYYLQSKDYAENSAGTHLDLENGRLQSYGNFTLLAQQANGSGVLLSSSGTTENPYLKITAVNTNDIIFLVDSENYYLRSSGFEEGITGTKFDLKNGQLQSYGNFTLLAKSEKAGIKLNSAGTTTNPFLQIIADNEKTIFYADNANYYLQSKDFDGVNKTQGVSFNLNAGKLEAYGDFVFKALKTIEKNGKNVETGVLLSSSGTTENPYLKIVANDGNAIFYADDTNYYLQSLGYIEGSEGTRLDLNSGKLQSYGDFTLLAKQGDSGIELNSSGTTDKPFLQIIAENEKIIFHADKSRYYLQSSNFVDEKQGTYFDLAGGKIEAYGGFTFKALDLSEEDENGQSTIKSGVTLSSDGDDKNPYLQILDGNEPIFFASKQNFYLKTKDFDEDKFTGLKLDLNSGKLTAFDFTLTAKNKDDESSVESGIIFSSSGDPYLRIQHNNNTIVNITNQDFLLQSPDQSLQFDIANGKIKAERFNLKAQNTNNNFIELRNDTDNFPLNINNNFKVDWDGSLQINTDAFKVDNLGNLFINNGAFKVDNLGNLSINNGAFKVDAEGNLSLGNNSFSITNEGKLTIANSAFNVDPEGNFWINATTLTNAPFYVDKYGNLKATKGTFGGWIVDQYFLLSQNFIDDDGMLMSDDLVSGLVSATTNTTVDTYKGAVIFGLFAPSLISANNYSPIRFFAGWTPQFAYDPELSQEIIAISSSSKFMVLDDGSLYANAAKITGDITTASGKIGGWEITPTQLKNYSGECDENGYYLNSFCMQVAGDGVQNALAIGRANENWWGHAAFRVTVDGKLYATDAVITGNITASTGCIGDFTIKDGGLKWINANNIDSPKVEFQTNFNTTEKNAFFGQNGLVILNRYFSDSSQTTQMSSKSIQIEYDQILFRESDRNAEINVTNSIEISDGKVHLEGTWWASNDKVITSDRNQKNSISSLTQQYDILFDALEPRLFKYNNGLSNRYHVGYIAQEVDNAIKSASLDRQNFAAICIQNEGQSNESWGLRYGEFISLNTWQIQKLKSRVKILEDEIIELKKIIKG